MGCAKSRGCERDQFPDGRFRILRVTTAFGECVNPVRSRGQVVQLKIAGSARGRAPVATGQNHVYAGQRFAGGRVGNPAANSATLRAAEQRVGTQQENE